MKLLSVLTLPYTVPADVVYATFTKFMVAAPQLGNGAWEVSKFFMDKLSYLLSKVNSKRQQISAKITCQLAITEYGRNKYDVEACQALSSENKMNLNFTLNLDDSELEMNDGQSRKFKTKEILCKPSVTINRSDTMDNDTFDHILKVTSQHDTIMAYYYLDENNKVKVTEIFDVTDSDSPIVQTSHERLINNNLEFDDELNGSGWPQHQTIDEHMSQNDLEDIFDSCTLLSDPESEWTGYKVEEPEDDQEETRLDHRPESERSFGENEESWSKKQNISSLTYEEMDT
ncbi:unnamed protein product [Acanthoscelides obtectus]|nr:unnamed protein product [Acanthoscelides obtectus]CAK1643769.1 hypothetical protein AOBTE_LOCUS13669 [Acanthoscelides obtectus]